MTDPYVNEVDLVTHLRTEDLLDLAHAQGLVVADPGLLESAAARPRTFVGGRYAYPSLQQKAAALADSICCNHALVDGNKRLTFMAVDVFLKLNGFELDMTEDQRFDLILAIAAGDLRGVDAIAPRMPLTVRKRPPL